LTNLKNEIRWWKIESRIKQKYKNFKINTKKIKKKFDKKFKRYKVQESINNNFRTV